MLLQPPPRAADGAVLTPTQRPMPLEPPRRGSREGLSLSQINLLMALGVSAVLAVVWLPRFVERKAAPGKVEVPPPIVSPEAPSQKDPLPAEAPSVTHPTPVEAPPVVTSAAVRREPAAPPSPAPSIEAPPPEPTPDREAEARALRGHRDSARAFEEKEEWGDAVREYEAALAVDPLVAFAVEGRERAGSKAALQQALDFHLRNPGRLSTETVAREAEALLERARSLESPGPRHRTQVADLERALVDARSTVTVQLESDGKTEVTLSRVGRLGTLTRRPLQLRPGTYTVVGSRPGYRDVRRQFTIAPRSPAQTVVVRCEEAI